MIWRCIGCGIAGLVIMWILMAFVPLVEGHLIYLLPLCEILITWWGASRAKRPGQGALHGVLTALIPAAVWTTVFVLIQYDWGGPQGLNISTLYVGALLFGPSLGVGALVGALVGAHNAKKLSLL